MLTGTLSFYPTLWKRAVSQVKVTPQGVHFFIWVEKPGEDEVSELPNSSANGGANSGRDALVAVPRPPRCCPLERASVQRPVRGRLGLVSLPKL